MRIRDTMPDRLLPGHVPECVVQNLLSQKCSYLLNPIQTTRQPQISSSVPSHHPLFVIYANILLGNHNAMSGNITNNTITMTSRTK